MLRDKRSDEGWRRWRWKETKKGRRGRRRKGTRWMRSVRGQPGSFPLLRRLQSDVELRG